MHKYKKNYLFFSTAFRILPRTMDFYFNKRDEIADRILYTQNIDGAWIHQHVSA